MLVYHPSIPEHFSQRNSLLQKCLRPDELPFAIEEEYPIVLATEGRDFSYCHDHEGRLCSHANLWPRLVFDKRGTPIFGIGLVGNVATDPDLRGNGHMRSLLAKMEEEAKGKGLKALVLWSDLSTFYHKVGYKTLGREFRFSFSRGTGRRTAGDEVLCYREAHRELDDLTLQKLIDLRLRTPLSLERTTRDFRRLLEIPWLDVFIIQRQGIVRAYALVGKGYDMLGVIHEWGAQSPQELESLIASIARLNEVEDTLLLAPGSLDAAWLKCLRGLAKGKEEVPMALAKVLDPQIEKELDELFIWGLDSI